MQEALGFRSQYSQKSNWTRKQWQSLHYELEYQAFLCVICMFIKDCSDYKLPSTKTRLLIFL